MSNGEDDAEDGTSGDTTEETVSPASFEERLDEVADALEDAETEGDLDDVEASLDEVEADLADVTLADDEDDETRDDLEDRIGTIGDDLEEQRGPYVEDVTDVLESAAGTVKTNKWTTEGEATVVDAVGTFFETAGETLSESFTLETEPVDTEGPEKNAGDEIAEELSTVAAVIGETALDPDDDAETIGTLLESAESLAADLEDGQVFGDLEIREQLRRQGFYDVLTPENRKDFPPEWNAVKLYEKQGEVEPLLTAFDKLDSDFMESNILDALEHIAPEEAFEAVHGLAQRRNKQPVRILGRIGDERAADTLEDFLGGGDVELEKESLRALGAIGSEDSTEPVAQRLVADNPQVRSAAARALGRIGDTRAIEPLETRLAEDDADEVRASAAWALNQIGTRRALDAVSEYGDDRSYLVEVEAQKA